MTKKTSVSRSSKKEVCCHLLYSLITVISFTALFQSSSSTVTVSAQYVEYDASNQEGNDINHMEGGRDVDVMYDSELYMNDDDDTHAYETIEDDPTFSNNFYDLDSDIHVKLDDDIDDTQKQQQTKVQFKSSSKPLFVELTKDARIVCQLDRQVNAALMWTRKPREFISVGKNVMKGKEKYEIVDDEIENGNVLIVKNFNPADVGEYTCNVSTSPPMSQVHLLEMWEKPEIKVNHDNHIVVREEGRPLTLRCDVTKGKPQPDVRWKRKIRKMPDGMPEINTNEIRFESVNRHHTGVYLCIANNSVDHKEVSKEVKVEVLHAPVILKDRDIISKRVTKQQPSTPTELELICTVHASPQAVIEWTKDGQIISPEHITNVRDRHVLRLGVPQQRRMGINGSSFSFQGRYTCKASNEYGNDEATFDVSGLAGKVRILTSNITRYPDSYLMKWVVDSPFSEVSRFRIKITNLSSNLHELFVVGTTRDNEKRDEDAQYVGQIVLDGLKSDEKFSAEIESENGFGWSQPTAFEFKTVAEPSLIGGMSPVISSSSHPSKDSFLTFGVSTIFGLAASFLGAVHTI